MPIPQSYMALTMAEFGHIAVEAMEVLGVRFTDEERDDIYHLWRYVGHVIGMSDELNLCKEADHILVEELYRLTSPGPGDDDRRFVVALTDDYLVPRALEPAARQRTAQARGVGDTDARTAARVHRRRRRRRPPHPPTDRSSTSCAASARRWPWSTGSRTCGIPIGNG